MLKRNTYGLILQIYFINIRGIYKEYISYFHSKDLSNQVNMCKDVLLIHLKRIIHHFDMEKTNKCRLE